MQPIPWVGPLMLSKIRLWREATRSMSGGRPTHSPLVSFAYPSHPIAPQPHPLL